MWRGACGAFGLFSCFDERGDLVWWILGGTSVGRVEELGMECLLALLAFQSIRWMTPGGPGGFRVAY